MISSAIIGITLVMVGTSVLMAVCQGAHVFLPNTRLQQRDISGTRHYLLVIVLNVIAIFGTYFGAVLLFPDFLIRSGPTRWYEPIVPIILYDFAYYWLHRAMHTKFLMRHLHGWHHLTKHPTAIDGLYQKPQETVLALSLLMVCVAIIGPISVTAFVIVICIHTVINMLDHANVRTGVGWLDHMMASHDLHHSRRDVYFGLTPLWDFVFGTTSKERNGA